MSDIRKEEPKSSIFLTSGNTNTAAGRCNDIGKAGVRAEEARKYRLEGSRVSQFFVGIRISGSVFAHFRMALPKIVIEELNMPADAQPVGEDAELGGVAEMAVDVLVSRFRVSGRGFGKQGVDALVRIIARVIVAKLSGLP